MTRYVTVKKASELTGYTEGSIRNRMCDGTWLEHYVWLKAPDGRVLINMEGYEKWVESGSMLVFGPVSSPAPFSPLGKGKKKGSGPPPLILRGPKRAQRKAEE